MSKKTVQITYIEHDGLTRTVDADTGFNVMEAAVWNDITGIYADCAGEGECATCHVYIDDAWRHLTGEPSKKERSILRFALEVRENSRLACQIEVTEDLDGLIVSMPERQF